MRRGPRRFAVAWFWILAVTAPIPSHGGESPTAIGVKAAISVDSTFPGYRIDVLSDGKWIEPGKEFQHEFGHPDRLGNGGNTWVSADTEAEHWIRLDWPRPVTLNEVEIWWSRDEWQPRAFRVEWLRDGQWISASGAEPWLAATDRQSIVPIGPLATQSLRILQARGGGGTRSLMAAQEVLVANRPGGARPMSGARRLTTAELRRLEGRELVRNIARLECPGASAAVIWLPGDRQIPAEWLADGDVKTASKTADPALGFGVCWPIPHVIDGVSLIFPGELPDPAALAIEVHDGIRWVAIRQRLRAERLPDQRRIVWSFEPTATRSVRARWTSDAKSPPPSEIEAYRYLPPKKDVWPERLIKKEGLKQQVLGSGEEPSFEALSLCALPMISARALLGLKDAPHEIGVAWDGTIIGRETLRFRFGNEQDSLADCRDTVRRRLIDGWRPGTVVEGQVGPLAVRQTAFVALAQQDAARPALWVRIELKNLAETAIPASVHVQVTGQGAPVRFHESALVRGDQVVLLSQSPAQAEPDGRGLRVDLTLGGKQEAHADFVYPQTAVAWRPALEPYRAASFDQALAWFRASWDKTLDSAVRVEVPEPRVGRMLKAVLAQIFINGDGDIMRYGSEPSVYREELYGIEESYAMLALALLGFGHDAQRYLDGTYLTPEFLKKVDVYKTYADRHQQYRNGLQPHYAVSAYRLTRDKDWIRKHLPLLRECAEWTIAQRRRTMTPGDDRPLHWGLLPQWAYGGDISDVQCYALYANYCCWRGLVDTAWLFAELGDAESAKRYADEARQYRAAIDRAVDGSYRKDHRPPFLPLRLYADRPDEQMDYYQLFAGCIFDLEPFEKGSRHFRWIADFLEADNRTFCFLPRFRRDVGPGGLDALYGKGYLLGKLHEDEVEEFLLGFYAFLAFNMDHETFASRETNVLYASDLHVRSAYEVPDMSDPLPCSSAVALHLLRHMLVTEERAGPGEYSGNLLLLPAVPKAWLADSKTIRIAGAPTHFGPLSFEVRSEVNSGRIEITVDPPRRNPCHAIKLRVRHPEGRPIRSVTVDGKPWPEVDPSGPWIVLPAPGAEQRIVVSYGARG